MTEPRRGLVERNVFESPSNFIAGRPMAARLFWFFGGFRCDVWLLFDGLRQAELCPRHTMMMNTKNNLIPDRSQPGITMTAPQQMTDTRFISVEKRANMSMGLDFLCTRT